MLLARRFMGRSLLLPQARIQALSTEALPAEAVAQAQWVPKKKKGRSRKRNYDRMHMRHNIIKKYTERNEVHEQRAEELGLTWDMAAATVVERCPIVIPEPPDWERDWVEMKESIEYYQQHDWPEGIGPTHPEKINLNEPGYTIPFELGSRVTAADTNNDTTSLERALPDSLYLMLRKDSSWSFPSATLASSEEKLGEAAERAVVESIEGMPRLFHFAKQPLGHFWYGCDIDNETLGIIV